jgi:hypothetical protein
MKDYVSWVIRMQSIQDPNNVDIRVEPKFMIPSGQPFSGGWCRPQTDAPGLRAIALATYAGNTARILEPTKVVNKRKIHDAIDALGAGGSTAMSAGIDIAYDMANKSFVKGHENRVVILSDGDANVGFTSYDSLLSQIKTSADKGVTLSTIGFGMGNYKDTLMEQLSNKGDGNNFYIDDATQAKRVHRLDPSAAFQATGCHCLAGMSRANRSRGTGPGAPSSTPQCFLPRRALTG